MPSAPTSEGLPGLLRGGKGGRGRGGAIPASVKLAVRDLVTECGIPVRNVPKVWAVVQAGLTGMVPEKDSLFTSSHIDEWIRDLSSAELLVEINKFWELKRAFPDLQLHVHHDATTRKAFEVGKHAKLMQYLVSYFNPYVGKAVTFLLSMRPLPGSGSAKATAEALAVCLGDMEACTIRASDDPQTPFLVELSEKGRHLVADLGSDNTDGALNVANELSKLLGETILSWPCPTHINALDGLNPMLKMYGKLSTDHTVASFDQPHPLRVHSKVSYIWSKHKNFLETRWKQLGLTPSWALLLPPPEGQLGKWESMGPALAWIINRHAQLIELMADVEFMTTNLAAEGSLHKDAGLLWRWLCNPDIYFGVLVAHSWFENEIEPIYEYLHSPSSIFPASGPHFRRQDMPRLALQAWQRARSFPPANSPLPLILAVAKKIPACVSLLDESGVLRVSNAVNRFEIPSQDRDRLLRSWSDSFRDALTSNFNKHWAKFLQAPNIFGLATDSDLGPFFVCRLIPMVLPSSPALSSFGSISATDLSAEASALTPLIDELFEDSDFCNSLISCFRSNDLDHVPEWRTLARAETHHSATWSREELPHLAVFFQNKFFGGFHGNLALEQLFSVYGQHINTEQGMALKEAIVQANERLRTEREARRCEDLRAKPLTVDARDKLPQKRKETGELVKSDKNRNQLALLCEQLLVRMQSEPIDLNLGAKFAKARQLSWELMKRREQAAFDALLQAKRVAGNKRRHTDLFGTVRDEIRRKRESEYGHAS